MPSIVWKGYISFGLVSFPVRLFSAARAEAVHFHMLHKKDLSRVKEVWYCAEEDKPIDRSDIVKGYEVQKDEYVVVDDADLKKIAPHTAATMEIVQFVKEGEVDPIYFERSYYVGPGAEITKPYALFLAALKQTKFHAIAKLSMHSREHVVLLRPAEDALILHTLYYADELHQANKQKVPATMSAKAKELDLATQLIRHLAAPFKPAEFHDTYRANVEKLIEEKSKGKKISVEPKPRQSKVTDLLSALKKSLENAAPAREKASATPKKRAAKRKAA